MGPGTSDPSEIGAWIDAEIERQACESGARPFSAPDVIRGDVLERCDYFTSFPDLAIPAEKEREFLTPAACYHVYSEVEGQRLAHPLMVTLIAPCGRNEKAAEAEPGRLREFHMREVVFVGPLEWVSRTRDEWMGHASAFARSIGLDGSMEPATDTFFGDPGRGRRLLQQLKRLKYELRMNVGGGVLPVSSFNLHEAFFTSRFDIAMADGSAAASGCAAFGIERWTLAYVARDHHAHLR